MNEIIQKTKISFFQKILAKFNKNKPTSSPKEVYIDGSVEVSPGVIEAIEASSASTAAAAKIPVVVNLTTSTSILATDTSLADIFTISVTQNITINCANGVNGKGTTWLLTQANGGSKTITLGSEFLLPDSATIPLVWSTTEGKTDLLAARYNSILGKWMVVSMVPGY